MIKSNYSRCTFFVLLAVVLIIFSFKDRVYSKNDSNHDRGHESIAIDTSTDRIFAVKENSKSIEVIDIKTGNVIHAILSNKEIKAIAIDEQSRILAAGEEKTIHIISIDTYQVLSSIPVKEEPKALSITSELGLLLLIDEEDKVRAIDLNTIQFIKELKVSKSPVVIAIDPELKLAVIVHNTWGESDRDNEKDREDDKDKNRDNITIIDLQTFSIIKTLRAGKKPVAVTVNTSTHEAAIANEKSNDITIIDLNSLKNEIATVDRPRNDNIKGTIPVGKHPAALSYNECLNTLSVIGGEDREWLEVIDMNTWTKTASYTFRDKLKDIKVHPYLNKAVISGEHGLNIISLPNPIPQLTSVTPDKALRGEKSAVLTITGKGLLKITEVYLNGNKASSTFLGCGSIKVDVPEEYFKNTGDIEITAINPEPQGGTSNPIYLKAENPIPQISTIDPLETKTNVQSLILTIYGTGFFVASGDSPRREDTEIYFGNTKKPITYISPIKLQINLTYEDLKTAGEYEITARNLSPGGGTSNKVIFTIKPSLEIAITSPIDGETINKAKTIVKGTFKSDTKDVGITVNGILADVIPEVSNRGTSSQWIANGVPLTIGANTITAVATDLYGNTDTKTITVYTNDITQKVTLSANITSGIPPLQVYFSASTEIPNPITTYQMDFEGDGIIDYTGTTFEDVTHTYTTEGIFYPTLTVTDAQGNIYSDTIAITVLNKTEIDILLKGKWEGMKGDIAQNDINSAVGYFDDFSKDAYKEMFIALSSLLPQIAQELNDIQLIRVIENTAEYDIRTIRDGKEYSFYLLFIRDGNGLWKIRSF